MLLRVDFFILSFFYLCFSLALNCINCIKPAFYASDCIDMKRRYFALIHITLLHTVGEHPYQFHRLSCLVILLLPLSVSIFETQGLKWLCGGRLRSRVDTSAFLTWCQQPLCLSECVSKCSMERVARCLSRSVLHLFFFQTVVFSNTEEIQKRASGFVTLIRSIKNVSAAINM